MVASYRAARRNRYLAAESLLALRGIKDPTDEQRVGAIIEAEYMLKVIHTIGGE